ncbi:hypothetical protein V6N13_145353 [Hibiscus sabdariffa]|uniref:Uncharacterized protein n=1 Tax=Hibiscus sabdariffa TaxID=183260 RepID=A0ABR2TPB9_9ROSI
METRNSKRRKNAVGVYNQMPEDEQPKLADASSSVDEPESLTAALASLTAKYKLLLAEKTDLEARVERAEKHVMELEELVKLKDAELAGFVEEIEEAYEEMNTVRLQVQKTLKKV